MATRRQPIRCESSGPEPSTARSSTRNRVRLPFEVVASACHRVDDALQYHVDGAPHDPHVARRRPAAPASRLCQQTARCRPAFARNEGCRASPTPTSGRRPARPELCGHRPETSAHIPGTRHRARPTRNEIQRPSREIAGTVFMEGRVCKRRGGPTGRPEVSTWRIRQIPAGLRPALLKYQVAPVGRPRIRIQPVGSSRKGPSAPPCRRRRR